MAADPVMGILECADEDDVVPVAAGGAESEPAPVTVTVEPVNDPPVFVSEPVSSATTGAEYVYEVEARDVDDAELAIGARQLPNWLTLEDAGNGTATLQGTPAAGDDGNDTVILEVSDPSGETATQQFALSVSATLAPVAADDAAETLEDETVTIDVLNNDNGTGGSLDATSLQLVDEPENGGVTFDPASGLVSYEPDADFNGTDVFTYTVANEAGISSLPAEVTVNVTPVNDPPTFSLGDDVATAHDAGEQVVPGFATGISPGPADEHEQHVSFTVMSEPAALFSETPRVSPDGTLRFTPAVGTSGTALVTVTARDDGGTADGGQDTSAPQTFEISVSLPNQAPFAEDDEAVTDEDASIEIDVLSNDSDPEGRPDPASVTIIAAPEHGTATVGEGGTITYVPEADFAGGDRFTYVLRDQEGLVSNEAGVTITVTAVNDAPTAPQITEPADGAEVYVGAEPGADPADPAGTLQVAWSEAADADDDPLTYSWQLATDPEFSAVLLSEDAGSDTQVEAALGAIAAILDAEGVVPGEAVTLYHRALASDGEIETAGAVAEVRMIRGTLVTTDGAIPPESFVLEAAYPNPFNPQTTIAFALPQAGQVLLAVYDPLGREVAVLVDGAMPAGRHSVVFSASEMPTGVYLYRLEMGSFAQTRRMLLVK